MSDAYTEFAPLKYDPQQIAHQGYGVAASGPGDDKLIVAFYRKSVLNPIRSKAEGRRICEDKDFVLIQHPGESLTKVDRPIQDSDKQRWPRQYAQYVQGKQQVPDGIPISLLFPAHPSITDMLIGYNIHTVEQLANLSANGIQTVGMGCQDWVTYAQKYLTQAEKGVNIHKFEKEIEAKDRQIATLERQVQELSTQVQNIVAKQAQPQPFDVQSAQIGAAMAQQQFNPSPVSFSSAIGQTRKSRSDKGKPRGPRKE